MLPDHGTLHPQPDRVFCFTVWIPDAENTSGCRPEPIRLSLIIAIRPILVPFGQFRGLFRLEWTAFATCKAAQTKMTFTGMRAGMSSVATKQPTKIDLMEAIETVAERDVVGVDDVIAVSRSFRDEGIRFGAKVLCSDGYRYAHELTAGDRLVTIDGRTVPIKRVTYSSGAVSDTKPIVEIPEGVLGANQATYVAHDQSLYMRHFLMSALFGAQEVLVPAKLLMSSGRFNRCGGATTKLCQIECAVQEIINADGLWLATSRWNQTPRWYVLDARESEVISTVDAVFRAPRLAS
jgi:hypothetical protein